MIEDGIQFNLPKNRSSVIKVIGVGGGGSNAVNHMTRVGVNGVDFIVCNTDAQALYHSPVSNKIQLGASLTEGLGAGADPEIGEKAARESISEITKILENGTKMCFITAGMGGGTGTGAAPVIARAAKEMGILTVGIITAPFSFEGNLRFQQAEKGISQMRDCVDSLIVINNDKLRQVYGDLGFRNAFSKADEVLAGAAKGIAEVITNHYTQNIDLRDARTVLENSGSALFGTGSAEGPDRATLAVTAALDSPLLNDNHIKGAQNILLLLTSSEGAHEVTIDEIGEITDHIHREAGGRANVIMGIGSQSEEGSKLTCTIIATGFPTGKQVLPSDKPQTVVHPLGEDEQLQAPVVISTPEQEKAYVPDSPKVVVPLEEEVEERVVLNLEDDYQQEDFPEDSAEETDEVKMELPTEEVPEDTFSLEAETEEQLAHSNPEIDAELHSHYQEDSPEFIAEESDPNHGFARLPEDDPSIFESSLEATTDEPTEETVHVLEWDLDEDLETDESSTDSSIEQLDEPAVSTPTASFEEASDSLDEPVLLTDEQETFDLDAPAVENHAPDQLQGWDLFSQSVEPEEEEIELVIVDEHEEEGHMGESNKQEYSRQDAVPPIHNEGDQAVDGFSKEPPATPPAHSENESFGTSTFTLDDIDGDGFTLNIEEIEASEEGSYTKEAETVETEYDAFDLSLSELPTLQSKAQQESITNSFEVPSEVFDEISMPEEPVETDSTLQLTVKEAETPAEEIIEEVPAANDMDRPISAVKSPSTGQFPDKVMDRISRLNTYQYKFKGNSKIEESERIPAYMRQGVDVDLEHKSGEKPSNISVDTDGNLKTNNSFLHDNVD